MTCALQPRLREPHFLRLLQPLHYYRAQSRPQTIQQNQTQLCQMTLTPCWDVTGCRGLSTLHSCMSGHPPQPKGPSDFNRASKQSTITRAYDSFTKIIIYFYSALYSSPYDLLLDGTVIEIQQKFISGLSHLDCIDGGAPSFLLRMMRRKLNIVRITISIRCEHKTCQRRKFGQVRGSGVSVDDCAKSMESNRDIRI